MIVEPHPRRYEPIVVSAESTVVAEWVPDASTDTAYQSEAELERELIVLLQTQAYEYLPITSETQLIANLRSQLEALNGITFSDAEWERFFTERIAGANVGIVEKTVRIQEDHVQLLTRDDDTIKNITLLDKKNIHNNRLQVINQYEIGQGEGGANYANRYDVTILVNGLPMVHIELKRRGVALRKAFNQINRYQRDSFWAGSGLFEYVQLFVISNGTLTKYYSNTTRSRHIDEGKKARGRGKKTSNTYEFTSCWADAKNTPIQELTAFVKTFFAKHTLLNVLTKYCVLTVDRDLLVMRPYQIVATERILQRIDIATNHKRLGTIEAGGYVWHTTGSGKTLTSFKTAQLASKLPSVDKVLFVVDRKDLDYQTMREYDRFEKGAANSNTSTAVLKKQLEDPSAKIIITTIQKLATFIKANKGHQIYYGHIVLIFDECHRSQFGDMHTAITKSFKRYNIFGFTGTPIFAVNSAAGANPNLRTTPQAFGCYQHGKPSDCPPADHQMAIHSYTIVNAIADKNVLPFRVDYVNTIKPTEEGGDQQVSGIKTDDGLLKPERLRQVTDYILTHFNQKTRRSQTYDFAVVSNVADVVASRNRISELRQPGRVRGFNALFATASIEAAKRYYGQFSLQQQHLPPDQQLKIGLIYSYAANEATTVDDLLDDEDFDTYGLDTSSREYLDDAIQDYNGLFGTSYDTSGDRFQNYYKDLSLRLKNREIDLVIVVNMFLTGFDATTLNTLFVDKHLVNHGLLQAYSRTNRILNSVKTYGNIVSFRNLEEETNDAVALFGNQDARGIVLLKPYDDYYTEYANKATELLAKFPPGEPIISEAAKKEFIALFGAILRLQNILTSFDEFAGNEIITARQMQDYRSIYLNLYAEFRTTDRGEKEAINDDDIVFEIELVKQVEINVDYILMLVAKWREVRGNGADKEMAVLSDIKRSIDSSPTLRNKRDLILEFVDRVSASGDVDEEWRAYVTAQREAELGNIIADENLKPDETREFVDAAFRDGSLPIAGSAVAKILPAMSRFAPAGGYSEKRQRVLDRLSEFFDRFYGLGVFPTDSSPSTTGR